MYKKNHLLYLAAVATMGSCTAAGSVDSGKDAESLVPARLTVRINGLETKVNGDMGDSNVESASVYVFSSDGTLDGTATSAGNTVTVNCSQGVGKKVYVVVNKPLSSISSISSLQAATTSLSDNGQNQFVMTGSAENVEVLAKDNPTVNVDVTRFASKVSIGTITNSLKETGWKDKTFTVKGIYLINVPAGNYPLFADSYTPSLWQNKMAWESGCHEFTADKAINQNIALNAQGTFNRTYYCYPNPTGTDVNGGTFSPRKTRLVIEVQIDTRTFYYPITLASVERNTHYSITNLTITRLGSSDPDYPVNSGQITFDLTVKPWVPSNMNSITI